MHNFQPKTLFLGKNHIYLPSCHSTNDIAAEIIQTKRVFDGTIVITSNQTAGRGQRGNTWEALPNQNITFSIILKPDFLSVVHQFRLNIAVSLGIFEFLCKYLSNGLAIKWPNDIYVGNKKMGGVLIENTLSGSRIAYSVIGIGLNINQLSFSNEKAISLRLATQKQEDFDIQTLIEQLCGCIEKYYLQLKNGGAFIETQKKKYIERLFRVGEEHLYEKEEIIFKGKIVDVADSGHLMMEVGQELKKFEFKEISFVI
ncbi:biotin/acetyl-CoA-carboxylase ligase [Emticicia oligotrophica DSM 17448]|uniref:Biotin/acetyl-CoA-carboxylase ligase n=1 Tax=Emticicia oligotrophica (strain DSM 17448 / CIP 109782 / MTCC 6937 / GPTSA100-15) TaxID=929562 RepID=A0ABM5MXB4_EMTOG|nr:biotin--[acetyl-CoA-carboxylase] ligase [Emticicia oligotrophica]AFK01776.1 biotin/acetyl-CoA-carboxylase ligase [Emticicia oligotrophica DSM 17448]